jgi:serine/threonine-protein kinase RsbW
MTLNSSLAEVERLGREFGHFADVNQLSKAVRFAVNLALEELVTNVINHGYKGLADQRIAVEVIIGPDEVTARVEDWGPPFDPLQAPSPDTAAPLDEREVGGLGIHLSKQMLDGLTYSRSGDKNCVDLRKRL